LLINIPTAQVSDTTGDAESFAAGQQKKKRLNNKNV